MSQTWTDDTFGAGHVAQTDLQNMENNFACLKSSFSGAAAPAGAVAGQLWFDTDQKVLKTRNAANGEWYGLMHGDTSEKRLVYRDAAMDGYARDAAVTDKVIALKGGAIYVAGAATAGSFTYTGFTHDHVHKWYEFNAAATDDSFDSAGNATDITTAQKTEMGVYAYALAGLKLNQDYYTDKLVSAVASDGADRPAAAVCILIYLDL